MAMRDYTHIDRYLDDLNGDVYSQPEDPGHKALAHEVIQEWVPGRGYTNVLDVGCGQGFCEPFFKALGIDWTGVTLGEDVQVAEQLGLPVFSMDMTFLGFEPERFDLIFARHVLEHSAISLLTLMEWHRVGRRDLILVAPNPEKWGVAGSDHYNVVSQETLQWWLRRSGWFIYHTDHSNPTEFRYLCMKSTPSRL